MGDGLMPLHAAPMITRPCAHALPAYTSAAALAV